MFSLKDELRAAARAALRRQLDDDVAREMFCEDFLRRWLITSDNGLTLNSKTASGSYFFLLWKNLSVTNISVSELMSLVRQHTSDRRTEKSVQVNFIGTERYKNFLSELWQSLFVPEGDPSSTTPEEDLDNRIDDAVENVLKIHENFFYRTIILDTYFTSVLVHIPLSLMVNIGAVTIRSGYVHSSGPAIYFRNIEKAQQEEFVTRLGRFLTANAGKRFFITPYAWEFFSPFETESSTSIRNGLDGVRIHLRKHNFEDGFLLNFVSDLKEYFPDQLSIPTGVRDYTFDRLQSIREGATNECTIWFVTDSGFVFDRYRGLTSKNKNIYIIAYAQTHLNSNQLNIFKERKPAWTASTTLPHTLSAAMVNIASHHWDLMREERGKRVSGPVIVDPFCGTGTTLIDTLIRFDKATVIGLDQSPLMPALVRNNLEFLAATPDHIGSLLSTIRAITSSIREELEKARTDGFIERMNRGELAQPKTIPAQRNSERDFEYCLGLLLAEIQIAVGTQTVPEISDAAVERLSKVGFSNSLIDKLNSNDVPFVLKVIFFLLWRALRMNTFSMRTEARTPQKVFEVFLHELDRSVKEYRDLERLLGRQSLEKSAPFGECIGSYSREGIIEHSFFTQALTHPTVVPSERLTADFIQKLGPGLTLACVQDSVSLMEALPQLADIIVTDPPYGFNALANDTADMKNLYARMVPALINILQPWGQLVMSLPAFAKNGKQIPFYQTRESVIKQVVENVEARGRKIVRFVETTPADRELFQPPWYWGTASTIERRVVHFVIR